MPEVPANFGDLPSQHFIANLVVLFIAWAVVSSALRGKEPDVIEADERDRRLRSSADHIGDWALTILVCWCAGLLAFQPAERLSWWLAPLIAANVLIGILIVKTLIEHAYLVGRYAWDRQ
jgi:membrane glycosyltransferase